MIPDQSPSVRRAVMPTSQAVARLFSFAFAAGVCCRTSVDPDLWGHLQFGLDILRDRRVPAFDTYAFTHDRPWINHEWLSEAIFAGGYRIAGVPGLLVLKLLLVASTLALVARALAGITNPARSWIFGIAAITLMPAATVRPQLWTFVAVPLVFLLRSLPVKRQAIGLLLLFAIWANLHGGWIVGLAVLGTSLGGRILDGKSLRGVPSRGDGPGSDRGQTPVRPLTAMLLVTAAALGTLMTPYGWRLWSFMIETVRLTRDISEWRPIWQQDGYGPLALWTVTAGVASAIWYRSRPGWSATLPTLLLACLALRVARLVPIFGETMAVLLGSGWSAETSPRSSFPWPFRIVDWTVAATVGLFFVPAVQGRPCLTIDSKWSPDVRTASALLNAQPGRLVVPFNWGEYAIWHFSGAGLRVSIDGRRETLYSDRVLAEQTAAGHGQAPSFDFLERVRPEYVWLPRPAADAAQNWLPRHGYRLDLVGDRSFIAVRSDRPRLHLMPPMPTCFP